MDLAHIIAELQAEKDKLDKAILALERLSNGAKLPLGRPRKTIREAAKVTGNVDSGYSADAASPEHIA